MTFKRFFALLLAVILLGVSTACTAYDGQIDSLQTSRSQESESTALPPAASYPTETKGEDPPDSAPAERTQAVDESSQAVDVSLPEVGGYYYDLTNVVLYLELYGKLPPNFITKAEARKLGWNGGSVEVYLKGAAIGGDFFGNYEELLPKAGGRSYYECDIDTDASGGRGSKRVVFSNDGLYFYTSDHYESFTQVFVTEDYKVIW